MDGTPANLAFTTFLHGHQEQFIHISRRQKHHFTISSCLRFCCANNRIIISFLHVQIKGVRIIRNSTVCSHVYLVFLLIVHYWICIAF